MNINEELVKKAIEDEVPNDNCNEVLSLFQVIVSDCSFQIICKNEMFSFRRVSHSTS